MLLELKLPEVNENMDTALIETIYAAEGSQIRSGSKFLDISVDLSSAFSQNCPPVSYYRLVVRENLWLRKIVISCGERGEAGAVMALFSTEADEALDAAPARTVRSIVAGINFHEEMWSGKNK